MTDNSQPEPMELGENVADDENSGNADSVAERNTLAGCGISHRANENAAFSERGPIASEGAATAAHDLRANWSSHFTGKSPTTYEICPNSNKSADHADEENPDIYRSPPMDVENHAATGKVSMPSEGAVVTTAEAQPGIHAPRKDLDTADDPWVTVWVKVEWPAEVVISKRAMELERAVQTALNTHLKKGNCKVLDIMENNEAKVQIKPRSVLEKLCQIQEINFKNFNTMAEVHFSPEPSAPPEPTQRPTTNQVQAKALQTAFQPGANETEEVDSGATTLFSQGDIKGEKENNITVPSFQYWHITSACSREIDLIQRRNGVDVKAEALVTISASMHKERECSIPRASEEFVDLFQKFAPDINCITVSISSPLDQGNMMKMLEEIQSEESKLVLSVSSKGCQLSGPKESLDRFQEKWSLKSLPQVSEMGLQRPLEIDLQDPLEKRGLCIEPFHWVFICRVFEKQVMAIKQKYGVDFDAVPAGRMLTVKAVSAGHQTFPLACHALKALEQLYQKGVTGLLDCPPENSSLSKVEQIKSTFQNICNQYPYVAEGTASGPWRLVGLPEHLWPAVKEIEERLGEPVFSQKAKMQMEGLQFLPTVSAPENLAGAAEEETCPICMYPITEKKKLKCKHEMCSGCYDLTVKTWGPRCPICRDVFGVIEGNQPEGKMTSRTTGTSLPGFPDCGTIEIQYHIPNGIQTEKHPKPGHHFHGAQRVAYLPDNYEGKAVLRLLERAFKQKLIFTVGTSNTTGASDTVTWNDIHHKTSAHGGPERFGYPDPDYLKRVKEELKAKGIE